MTTKLLWEYISPTTIKAKSITGKLFEIYVEFCQDVKDNFNIELQAPHIDFMLKYNGEGVDFLESQSTTELETKAFKSIDRMIVVGCWYPDVKSAIEAANNIEVSIHDNIAALSTKIDK